MNLVLWIVESSFALRLTTALLHFMWQGCVAGLLVIAGSRLLANASARWRYLLNVVVMVMMAACVPATFWLQRVPHQVVVTKSTPRLAGTADVLGPTPNLPQITVTGIESLSITNGPVTEHDSGLRKGLTSDDPAHGSVLIGLSNQLQTVAPWIVASYFMCVALILARLVFGVWGGHQLQRSSRRVDDPTLANFVRLQAQRLGLRRLPTMAWCEQISVPVVVGILRPLVLLPMVAVSGLTPLQLQALLMHELAHIRRFDPLVNLFQRIVEAGLFFHPVVWFVSRQISIERELAADDMVLAAGWGRPIYADALVRMAELSTQISPLGITNQALVLGAAGTSMTEFKRRVLRLLDDSETPKFRPRLGGVLGMTLVLFSLLGTTVIVHARSQTDPPAIKTAKPATPAVQIAVDPTPDAQSKLQTKAIPPDPIKPAEPVTVPAKDADQKEAAALNVRQLQKRFELDKVEYFRAAQANRILPGTVTEAEITRLRVKFEASERQLLAAEGAQTTSIWGAPVNGLRLRAVPVYAAMKEDAVDLTQRYVVFAKPEEVAFAVELENVSDKPIKLLDTRYGTGYGASTGKANSNWSGQFLYSINLFDRSGKKIERPAVEVVDLNSVLDGQLVVTLEPGGKLRTVLRPTLWLSAMTQRMEPGSYRASVRYHGLPARVATRIQEYEPESPVLESVAGDVVSPQVTFDVLPPLKPLTTQPVVWGKPVNGLRAAMDLRPRQATYGHGEKPDTKLLVQNVSDKPITLSSHLWQSFLQASMQDDTGAPVEIVSTWYSGWTHTSRVTLAPDQIVMYDAGNLGLAVTKARADKFEDVTHRKVVAPAGQYTLQLEGTFGGQASQLKDGKGKVLAPLEGDWSGKLMTGAMPLTITNEVIDCHVTDAETGLPVSGTTTKFEFIKPKTADTEETVVTTVTSKSKPGSRVQFSIPDLIMQRPDREELEVRWSTEGHTDYEPYSPTARIPLKQFFQEGTQAARAALNTIKLTPKKKAAEKKKVEDGR